jgi:hypothetical protein
MLRSATRGRATREGDADGRNSSVKPLEMDDIAMRGACRFLGGCSVYKDTIRGA